MPTSKLHDNPLSKISAVDYSPLRCLRSRYNKSECDSCLLECQTGALYLEGRVVTYNRDKCTGCMRCVSVCPNDAFEDGFDTLPLLENLVTEDALVLSCRKNWQGQDQCTIPCIGLFSEPVLAVMIHLVKTQISFDSSRCADCENEHALLAFQNRMQKLAAREIDSGQKVKKIIDQEKNSSTAPDQLAERRSLLHFYRKTIVDFSRKTVKLNVPDQTNSRKTATKKPTRNSIALQFAIDNLHDETEKRELLSYYFSVHADKHCDLCPACHGMCPTGALKREQEDRVKTLTFTSSRCNGCGICRDFCKNNALTITKGFSGNPKKRIRIM